MATSEFAYHKKKKIATIASDTNNAHNRIIASESAVCHLSRGTECECGGMGSQPSTSCENWNDIVQIIYTSLRRYETKFIGEWHRTSTSRARALGPVWFLMREHRFNYECNANDFFPHHYISPAIGTNIFQLTRFLRIFAWSNIT